MNRLPPVALTVALLTSSGCVPTTPPSSSSIGSNVDGFVFQPAPINQSVEGLNATLSRLTTGVSKVGTAAEAESGTRGVFRATYTATGAPWTLVGLGVVVDRRRFDHTEMQFFKGGESGLETNETGFFIRPAIPAGRPVLLHAFFEGPRGDTKDPTTTPADALWRVEDLLIPSSGKVSSPLTAEPRGVKLTLTVFGAGVPLKQFSGSEAPPLNAPRVSLIAAAPKRRPEVVLLSARRKEQPLEIVNRVTATSSDQAEITYVLEPSAAGQKVDLSFSVHPQIPVEFLAQASSP
jgi:hypothetical protein